MRNLAAGNRAEGFTLLEILVATAILGTSVAALFGLLSGSLGNMQRLQAPSKAMMLGQSRMNELLAAGVEAEGGKMAALPLDQKLEGRWDDEYRWEAMETRFSPLPVTGREPVMLVRITLDVFWKSTSGTLMSGKPEKKLTLETVQLRQTPPEATQEVTP